MIYKRLSSSKYKEDENIDILLNKKSRKKPENLLLLSHSHELRTNDRPNTAKYFYPRNTIIKSHTNSIFNSISLTKKPTSPTTVRSIRTPAPNQIFMRLDQRDQIEKIIKEESRKIYFKQRINYGQHLSVEEFRSRFMNPIPQNAYKRHLQRRIKEKLKTKSFFKPIKNMKKPQKTIDSFNKINTNIIDTKRKLIRNFSSFSSEREIKTSKKNTDFISDFFEKAEKEKKKLTKGMIKQINVNKKGKFFMEFSRNNGRRKVTKKYDEIEFNKFKNKLLFKKNNKLREKARVFDTVIIDELNSNLEKIKSMNDDTHNKNQINYVALTNKIYLSNLIKQMRLIYIKDPAMNILRGNNTKKISELQKEIPLFDEFEELYNLNDTDITISRYNKIKLSLPKFIKTRFKKSTNFKYGHIIDNYFGIPV